MKEIRAEFPCDAAYFGEALEKSLDDYNATRARENDTYRLESKDGESVAILVRRGITARGDRYAVGEKTGDNPLTYVFRIFRGEGSDGRGALAIFLARITPVILLAALFYGIAVGVYFLTGHSGFLIPLIAPGVYLLFALVRALSKRALVARKFAGFLAMYMSATTEK